MPANFVLWLLAAAIVVLVCTPRLRKTLASGPQKAASIFGYPGLVFATGIGFLLVLDLSANGQPGNRYLALYHQGHLWFGMLAFSLVAFVRQPLGRSLSWMLSLFDGLASNVGKRVGATGGATLFLVSMLALVGAVGSLLPNSPQLTSEIGRLWLIVGAAWFFFMRGTPFTERLARSGNSLASLFRYVWPLLFVVIVLIGAMAITHDMGPLLIAGYAAGAFVAASVAMWLYQRLGTIVLAYALAVALFVGWILVTTAALFRFGSLDEVAAGRLENLAAPLASANDQLALVTWFQRATPAEGFGTGAVPWCGFGAGAACAGVPGADPKRLHVHRDGWCVRMDGGLGAYDRLRDMAARAHPQPWAGNARRAPLCPDRRPHRERPPGVRELALRDVGRARAVPARGDRRRQSRGHSAHRCHVPIRELRPDFARGEHVDARAGRQPQCTRRGREWLNADG